jgi:hypothetical protein
MKLRKLAFSFILLLGVMMLVAPMTHAQSSQNVEFVLDQDKIYLDDGGAEVNPTTHEFHLGYWFLGNHDGGMVTVDLRDYASYSDTKDYTMTIYNVTTSSVEYTGEVLWFQVEEDGTDFWFYNYTGFNAWIPGTNDLKIYWEESAEDFAPVIDGETAFVTTVDNPITESEVRSYLSAIDETDGNITHLITLSSDNYTPNNDTLGTYDLVYSVTDSGGNTATLTVSVIVKDVLAPTWNTSKQNVTVSYTATFDIEAYKSQLGASDNYDASGSIAISIDANTYTTNKTIPGTYQVVYALEDLSGNSSLAEVNVTVIDDVKPTFSGATTITKPLSNTMTITQIKSQISANDAIDGNLTANIQVVSDEYTGNGHIFGDYDVQFSVTDNSGNIAYHTVTVQVIDDIPPVFYVRDGYFVAVDQVVSLSQQDFIDILVATGQITVSGSGTVEIYQLLNEYEGNESTPGIYALSFQAVTQSGDESIYNMAVEVLETTDGPVDVIEDQDGQDLALFWNTNKTYIIGGLILLLFVGLGIVVARKTKRHIPKKKKYKKVRK